MEIDELIRFNPILAEAMEQTEKIDTNPVAREMRRAIVAACIKAGAEPEKIYATIRTGRLLTRENMKLLKKADLKEWSDACSEYRRLVRNRV